MQVLACDNKTDLSNSLFFQLLESCVLYFVMLDIMELHLLHRSYQSSEEVAIDLTWNGKHSGSSLSYIPTLRPDMNTVLQTIHTLSAPHFIHIDISL